MDIQVRQVEYRDVEAWRDLYRQDANCQIIHDSNLRRGFAIPYLLFVNGRAAGYGAVANPHESNCLAEFYVVPSLRHHALPMYRTLLTASGATQAEAQTNMPLMLLMLYDCATNITTDAILFEDAFTTQLACPNGVFRQISPDETDSIFAHSHEPVGNWGIDVDGVIVATGGFFTHYNPPYGDVYMEVAVSARRLGYGSFLVQELKRVCYEAGKKPAARTGTDNVASRNTLQKAGLLPCGRMLVGEVQR